MKIEKTTIHRPQKKCIQPAQYLTVDTGDRLERKIIKEDGSEAVELVPVVERVFQDAVFEDVMTPHEVHVVKTIAKVPRTGKKGFIKSKGGILMTELEEEHHFANEADAQHFIEETNKALKK